MDQEKIDEYYRNVKVMADSFYGLGKMVMKRTQMDDNTVMSLLNLDLLSFLMYLCDDGKPNNDEIQFIRQYTQIDMPPEYWNHMLSDLNIDLSSSRVPQIFDMFIEFDNQLFRQGVHKSTGSLFLSIYQALGVGLEGADRVINQKELDKLKDYIIELKKYYQNSYIGNEPLEVEPINPEVIKIISYPMDNEYSGIPVNDGIPHKPAHYFDVRFLDKTYKVPEDAVVFIKSREFVGKELIKLIKESSDMIVRYSNADAPKFFENFNDEIKNYHSVMLEACQDIVDDLISRDIYDVSVTDFAEKLSGFKAVQDLGNKVIIKATNEIQKLVDEKNAGENYAYRSAANTITGSGIRVFTNSFASLMVYSTVEKHIMLSQAKKADQQYEKAVQKIQAACKDALNQICTNILINDFGMGLVEIIETFNNELMQNYLLELTLHGEFNVDNIEGYSENRSNAILENMSRVSDKRKLLIQAYEACPFNIDVYEKILEMGFFDVNTFMDAKQIFPVETLQSMVESQIDGSSASFEKMDEYVAVLTDYADIDEKTVIKKYFSKYADSLIKPFENIKKICGNNRQLDSWIRENISKDMDRIVAVTDEDISDKVGNWLIHKVDEQKIKKLYSAGVNPFEKANIEDADSSSYDYIKKYYADLLIIAIKNYIDEAIKRKNTYEQAYKKYNAEFDKQREKVEGLKRELENSSFFAFSKKKELKEKVAIELAELNKLKEPSDLKKVYYDMYK